MTRLDLSPQAESDLIEIWHYSFDAFGEAVADNYLRSFDVAFDLLQDFPMAGTAAPQLGTGLRCLVHKQHRIFYRIEEDVVLILRMVHHARDAVRVL